jgi:hypothetical protein
VERVLARVSNHLADAQIFRDGQVAEQAATLRYVGDAVLRHMTSWTGVELGGGPAPPTPENIAAVMNLYPVGERFFQEFTLRQVLLNAPPALQANSLTVRHEQVSCCNVVRPVMRPYGRWPR